MKNSHIKAAGDKSRRLSETTQIIETLSDHRDRVIVDFGLRGDFIKMSDGKIEDQTGLDVSVVYEPFVDALVDALNKNKESLMDDLKAMGVTFE